MCITNVFQTVPFCIFSACLFASNSLAGNRDRSRMSVFVVGIDPDGAAAQDGRLKVADEILNVSDGNLFHLFVAKLFLKN